MSDRSNRKGSFSEEKNLASDNVLCYDRRTCAWRMFIACDDDNSVNQRYNDDCCHSGGHERTADDGIGVGFSEASIRRHTYRCSDHRCNHL